MRPRTCHPMPSTPPQPPQPRPSHPPHPVSPGPAHAATFPTAATSSSLPCPGCFRRVPLSLPHTRPRAARTFCRRCGPLRPSRAACRCPMRPRTCHPMQSTPPQPTQPRPSHPPHPVSPCPAHAATLPTAAASSSLRVQAASDACLSASRTPARVPHAPSAVAVDHYALPVPLAAAPLARVGPIAKLVRARALPRLRHHSLLYSWSSRGEAQKGTLSAFGGGGTMHASTRPGSRWRTCRCVHGQSPVWDAALQRPVIAETARESGNCQGESACWSRCCGEK
jgi:hypothetical protein